MKKMIFATVAICLIGFGMGSCKKSYACDCTIWLSGDTTNRDGKGKDAAQACDKEENTFQLEDCWPA